jgi:hypothetical protein
MKTSVWIWYPGDFEIYHNMLLHCRREDRDLILPAVWHIDNCYPSVLFRRRGKTGKADTLYVKGTGLGYVEIDKKKYPYGEITLEPGEHEIVIAAASPDGLPAVYVRGGDFDSGEGWETSCLDGRWLAAGWNTLYGEPDDNPEVFKFSYKTINPKRITETNSGVLYDFGREIFAKLRYDKPGFSVFYGESEALDTRWSYLRDTVSGSSGSGELKPRAFRYVFVPGGSRPELTARHEYLPLKRRGSFCCSDEKTNRIWDTAAYTFELNCREFFLDGIKRDRWVWSGDAYQSYFVNNYLFFDTDITKRTMIALRGRDPVRQHINTILDYSFYWIIAVEGYYKTTGDMSLVRFLLPGMKSLMDFCRDRRDEHGFAVGREGDWVFIDWADMDKTGALASEQFLFARALEAMAYCLRITGFDEEPYRTEVEELIKKIDEYFWDDELHAYIDGFESGKRNVTRHANIFAVLFGYAGGGRKDRIIRHVLDNEQIPEITTPYFKFYELEALCKTGKKNIARERMLSYWGGMLDLGVTTFWEEYYPEMQFPEHYAMYGDKFGKSLCHAWASAPIYLLGRYFLGVETGSEGFIAEPDLGGFDWIEGKVPSTVGDIEIYADKRIIRVYSETSRGILINKGQEIEVNPGERIEIPNRD